MGDWFRRSSWSPVDIGEFERRLMRARPRSRPQYLRIQAWYLAEVGLHVPALELLERVVASPDVGIELAQAHCQRGDIFVALDRIEVANDASAQASPMPVDQYEAVAARALILDALGRRAEAQLEAEAALRAAGATKSGFRWHPEVGLVKKPGNLEEKLRRIVG